jgi:membrane-bound lytic murein transglycosylase F
VFSPDENILGGARYLKYMKSRIPKRIRDPDRTWLAIAAYNIGIGHLEDGRVITQMRKKNPDRWADVRQNLTRLSDPAWHSRVKHGYANGRETVQFVERVTQFAAILETRIPDPKA